MPSIGVPLPLDPLAVPALPDADALPAIFLYFASISAFIPDPPLSEPDLDGRASEGISVPDPEGSANRFPPLQLPFKLSCSKGPPRCGLPRPGPSIEGVGAPDVAPSNCQGDCAVPGVARKDG